MGWLETLKDAWSAAEKLHDAKLNILLGKAMMEGAELAQENASLRDGNRTLRERLDLRAKMHFDNGVYWQDDDDGERIGPFCQKCWDSTDRAVRLVDSERFRWHCTVCGQLPWKPGGREDYRAQAAAAGQQRTVRDRWRVR
jgi:hypothetical protein